MRRRHSAREEKARYGRPAATDANAQGAPVLAVEILSESTRKRDLTLKRRLYAVHGVEEYWVVDPVLDSVAVYRGEELTRHAELTPEDSDTLTSPLLPGFELPLDRLF